ncbi:uncharacterized protein LY89DRAFT_678708 [Mollisia scopiformis]|uniref:Uncharacterized protein n=1 Tax=Mollisia scopiformis TaxID=149040 RepID=A0A132B226_MOLSC|nr:uncharacterized protein LY89DRAFT_678708 [Mollisia scopiformis]KUJ06436.1 hypothetical protein LY89DRAFT_678708 [Mollisia scopiformis]
MSSSEKAYNQPFRDAFTSKLTSSSDLVQHFLKPINATLNKSEEEFEDSLWYSWQDVTSLACQTLHDQQEGLVSFVSELRNQPGPLKENGEKGTIRGEEVEWKQLPMLGMELRSCWNTSPQGKGQSDESWVNLNAFAARLTALSFTGDCLDFSLYAIWTFREAFEDSDLMGKLPNASFLQAAAVWMIYASGVLKERAESNRCFDGKKAREGKALEGKGWSGFSVARWQLWVERLGLVKERCQDEKTGELLVAAASTDSLRK